MGGLAVAGDQVHWLEARGRGRQRQSGPSMRTLLGSQATAAAQASSSYTEAPRATLGSGTVGAAS
eukprot:1311183-Pleurochrysis_carterae.AAC.1